MTQNPTIQQFLTPASTISPHKSKSILKKAEKNQPQQGLRTKTT